MKYSSRRQSCPICDRNVDDKCRWNSEMIFCYNGDSFSPPHYLSIGDRIKIGQSDYALFSQTCGFSGNSYGFALVDDFDYRFLRYEDKKTFRRKSVKITRIVIEKQSKLYDLLHALRDECDFHEMNLDEFYANKRCAKKAESLIEQFVGFLALNKRFVIDYLSHVISATEWEEKLRAMLRSVYDFEHLHFDKAYDD